VSSAQGEWIYYLPIFRRGLTCAPWESLSKCDGSTSRHQHLKEEFDLINHDFICR
jgi:hypothetical protein